MFPSTATVRHPGRAFIRRDDMLFRATIRLCYESRAERLRLVVASLPALLLANDRGVGESLRPAE